MTLSYLLRQDLQLLKSIQNGCTAYQLPTCKAFLNAVVAPKDYLLNSRACETFPKAAMQSCHKHDSIENSLQKCDPPGTNRASGPTSLGRALFFPLSKMTNRSVLCQNNMIFHCLTESFLIYCGEVPV